MRRDSTPMVLARARSGRLDMEGCLILAVGALATFFRSSQGQSASICEETVVVVFPGSGQVTVLLSEQVLSAATVTCRSSAEGQWMC